MSYYLFITGKEHVDFFLDRIKYLLNKALKIVKSCFKLFKLLNFYRISSSILLHNIFGVT